MADKQALYLKSPEIPTPENFDQLIDKYGGATFSAEPDSWNLDTDAQNPPDANETSRYEVNYLLSNRRKILFDAISFRLFQKKKSALFASAFK